MEYSSYEIITPVLNNYKADIETLNNLTESLKVNVDQNNALINNFILTNISKSDIYGFDIGEH